MDDGVVVEERNILARHIEIDVLVAMPVEEVFEMPERDREVIAAAEANDLVKEMRKFKGEIDGMPGAEAAAGSDDGGVGVLMLYEREDFGQYIFFVLKMAEDPFDGMEALFVKALFIDA